MKIVSNDISCFVGHILAFEDIEQLKQRNLKGNTHADRPGTIQTRIRKVGGRKHAGFSGRQNGGNFKKVSFHNP